MICDICHREREDVREAADGTADLLCGHCARTRVEQFHAKLERLMTKPDVSTTRQRAIA